MRLPIILISSIFIAALCGGIVLMNDRVYSLKPADRSYGVQKTINPAIAENEKINAYLVSKKPPQKPKHGGMAMIGYKEVPPEFLKELRTDNKFFDVITYKDLELYNLNTGERLNVAFWAEGEYIEPGLKKLDKFMRDWRRNKVIDIDPDLYMLIYDLHDAVQSDEPIHLISGHRSQKTNTMLRKMGRNTAKKSQHVLGRAADIRMPDIPVSVVRKEALKLKRGGVGYYPSDNFVHVDTGRVRQW